MDSQAPSENENAPQKVGFLSRLNRVPIGVAIAGLILALLLSGLILTEIVSPLSELVFGRETKVPVPEDARLLETVEHSATANKEWLYGVSISGCDLVKYYAAQGASCVVSPLACGATGVQRSDAEGVMNIATCSKREDGSVTGYGWDVYISSNFPEGDFTRFRVSLFK